MKLKKYIEREVENFWRKTGEIKDFVDSYNHRCIIIDSVYDVWDMKQKERIHEMKQNEVDVLLKQDSNEYNRHHNEEAFLRYKVGNDIVILYNVKERIVKEVKICRDEYKTTVMLYPNRTATMLGTNNRVLYNNKTIELIRNKNDNEREEIFKKLYKTIIK